MAAPRHPEVAVLALVPDRWDGIRMPRHQVLERLGRHFRVTWLEPAPHWRKVLAAPREYQSENREVAPGVTVQDTGRLLPAVHNPAWLKNAALSIRLRLARRRLRGRGCRFFVLYLWRPEFERALELVPHDLSCYHIDDEYTFSREDLPVPEREATLLRTVDQVFIHSPALLEKKGHFNPHTAFVPNGVDFDAFARPAPEPADLQRVPHPRIGYAGMLKGQLDWDLLLWLTERHPVWNFVFVGGRSPHPEIETPIRRLRARANVHFLGAKSVEELCGYPQHFDACIMPYRMDEYTRFIYPLKLHEYLASGKPTIGSPIRSLRAYARVLWLPKTAEEWSTALEEALQPVANSEDRTRERRATARRHDWNHITDRVAGLICRRLSERGVPVEADEVTEYEPPELEVGS